MRGPTDMNGLDLMLYLIGFLLVGLNYLSERN